MDNSHVRRRTVIDIKQNYSLIYQLVILLRSRKEMMYLYTKSSLAMRIAGLCDLCLLNVIELDHSTVKVVKGTEDPILKEFVYAISQKPYDPKKLVKSLNGELTKSNGIKNLRNKVYKEMSKRNLVKTNKVPVYNRIILQNDEAWESIYRNIVDEASLNYFSTKNVVLLICLDYIDKMESILLQSNEKTADFIVKTVEKYKDIIKKKLYSPNDELIYEFLKTLI